jgi:osmotically-inducible protein OsmY
MRGTAVFACSAVVLALFAVSCSQKEQSDADARARAAEQKVKAAASETRAAVEQLAHRAKQKSNNLAEDMDAALNHSGSNSDETSDTVQSAASKARHMGDRLKTEADHVALQARVKAKLANEVGLNTVTGVDVDTSGQVVTLSGVVPTEEDKHRAESAWLQCRKCSTLSITCRSETTDLLPILTPQSD